MKHKILISTIAASLLMFSGCGSSDDESNVNGTVADGYIRGAKVFLDLNCNNQQDNGEISTTTDENGKFTFNTDANITGACIVSEGGFDIERGVDITTSFVVPASSDANATPLTTMAYTYAVDNNVSYTDATTELASKLGLTPAEFTADPEKKPEIKTVTTQIQSAIDLIVETNSSVDPKELYKNVAKNIASVPSAEDLNLSEAVTENMPIDDKLKEAVLFTVDKVKDMVENDDFEDFSAIQTTLVDVVDSEVEIDNLDDYISLAIESKTKDMTNAIENINSLSSDLNTLQTTAKSKTATVTEAKSMISQIRETIYEFIDPNIDNQEDNTSTMVGNIIANVNNALDPSITNIKTTLNDVGTHIDTSLTAFDEEINGDFNTTLSALDERLSAIADVLNSYEENESFSDISTTYGDTLSHTYNNDNGVVTDTYTINDKTLTVVYPEEVENLSDIDVKTDGEIVLTDDNYSLNISALAFNDNKLSLITKGNINGEDNATITGDINIAVSIDENQLNTGYLLSSLNNLNISVNGNIKTSTNKEFNGLFSLTDTKLELNGTYTDSTNNISLNGTVSMNSGNTVWKKYIDEDEIEMDSDEELALVEINNKLVTMYTINYQTNDVNLTTFDGTTYECSVTDFWPDLEGLQCKDEPTITKIPYSDLEGKIVTLNVNNTSFIIDDIWADWDYIGNDVYNIELKVDSMTDYDIYEENGVAVLEKEDGSTETVTSISYTTSEPLNATELLGDIKVSGKIIDGNTQASLNLSLVKNSANETTYYIDNLSLIADNVEIQAPNLLKVTAINEEVSAVDFKDFNASVADINGYKAKLIDVTYNGTYSNATEEYKHEYYGQISYLDTVFTGYTNIEESKDSVKGSIYIDVTRIGYEPFTIISNGEANEESGNISILIKKGDYEIGGTFAGGDAKDVTSLYDNNGVFFNAETIYNEDSDDETTITLTDKDGNKLADIDTSVNSWEIKYSDNSTETLY